MSEMKIITMKQRMWVIILKGKNGGIVHGTIADTKRHAINLFLKGTTKPWKEWSGRNGCYDAVSTWCSFNVAK